jgi:hypothetical protein
MNFINIFLVKEKISFKIITFFTIASFILSPLIFQANVKSATAKDATTEVAGTIAACFAAAGLSGVFSGAASAVGLVVPTSDAGNTTVNSAKTAKDCSLDGIANGVKRVLVRSLVDATVE